MSNADVALVDGLRNALIAAQPQISKWLGYYAGKQDLTYLAPELAKELEGRVRSVVVNWPRLVVDSLEERLDVEGFRIEGRDEAYLWEVWQANNLDELSQQAHSMALTAGRAYIIVGSDGPEGLPLITVESPTQVIAQHDPRTREVASALKMWRNLDGTTGATLYLPDRTVWLTGGKDAPQDSTLLALLGGNAAANSVVSGWNVDAVDVHNLGIVPVVPLVNRGGILDYEGTSELADIVPLSDAATKAATDMMISAEYHAIPRRWVVGMSEEDMQDEEGRPLSRWDRLAGRIWAVDGLPSETQLGQFPEADLRNFHDTIRALSRLVASLAGLPPHFLGSDGNANPASADAIRSAETRLIKRAERRQRAFGGSWEQVARLAFLIGKGEVPPNATRLEAVWRDPANPTVAQRADAVVKLRQAGIIPLRQAREDLGYTIEQVEIMAAEDAAEAERILGSDPLQLMGPKPAKVIEADEGDDESDDAATAN